MPELPEVETTRLGILPHLAGQRITQLRVHHSGLRWPVAPDLPLRLSGQIIRDIERRAKYILIQIDSGTILIHLGMSGSLRVLTQTEALRKHDHIELLLENGTILRYHDPRRFGAWLWQPVGEIHAVLQHLGPEPLSHAFHANYLHHILLKRQIPIKTAIMDNRIVVGIGNIYACESLFMTGISPLQSANSLKLNTLKRLIKNSQTILAQSIAQGGTTLRDFVNAKGEPGYFQQTLHVYGRESKPCLVCTAPILRITQSQRSTFYCPQCQPLRC